MTSLLFLRVTCPCSLRTYATLKFIRSSSSSSSSLLLTLLWHEMHGLYCADVPLRNYSMYDSRRTKYWSREGNHEEMGRATKTRVLAWCGVKDEKGLTWWTYGDIGRRKDESDFWAWLRRNDVKRRDYRKKRRKFQVRQILHASLLPHLPDKTCSVKLECLL